MKFKELYKNAPMSLRQELDRTRTVEQSKIWHPENFVFIHIQVVTDRLENYNDINLTLAGLFHDLGKTDTTFFNTEKDTYSAFGHEDESVVIMQKYKSWIISQGADFDLVEYIVANHMRIKYLDEMRLKVKMNFFNDPRFIYVQKFASADYGGDNLECKELPDNTEVNKQIEKYFKTQEENKIINSKFNGHMIMAEFPNLKDKELGSAISNFKKSFDDFNNYVLKNTSSKIMSDFKTFLIKIDN